MTKIKYIAEIDGLRAVAVLSVIFFHLGYKWIPGGFLGVDVFFVISGYLITAILLQEKGKAIRLYLVDFYLRRLRRIFPAFFTMVLFTLGLAYFFLSPQDYLELSRSALSAIGFVSNIYFFMNTGYFDAPVESMALLHTWSLSVEEQFYLFWPAFVLLLGKFSRAWRRWVFASILCLSFLLSVFISPLYPKLAFYNFPFRIFQFCLGAMIPLFFMNRIKNGSRPGFAASACFQILGISVILFSALYFSGADVMPGWKALVPSVGACLFIIGTLLPGKPGINPIKNRLMIGMGKISFSLYLWHWPIVILYKVYNNTAEIELVDSIVLFVIILLLSATSYRLIEQPLRQNAQIKRAVAYSTAMAAGVLCFVAMIFLTGGTAGRFSDAAQFASLDEMWHWDCPQKIETKAGDILKTFGHPWKTAGNKIVLWGDSHAQQLAPLLEKVAQKHRLSFAIFPSCRPLTDGKSILIKHRNPKRATKGCYQATLRALDFIGNDKKIGLVIISGSWRASPHQLFSPANKKPNQKQRLALMEAGLSGTVERILDIGPDVLLLGDTPMLGRRIDCVGQDKLIRRNKLDCQTIPWPEVLRKQGPTERVVMSVAQKYDNVYYHSILENFCTEDGCPMIKEGSFIFRDKGHIRRNLPDRVKQNLVSSFGLLNAVEWVKYSALK